MDLRLKGHDAEWILKVAEGKNVGTSGMGKTPVKSALSTEAEGGEWEAENNTVRKKHTKQQQQKHDEGADATGQRAT